MSCATMPPMCQYRLTSIIRQNYVTNLAFVSEVRYRLLGLMVKLSLASEKYTKDS